MAERLFVKGRTSVKARKLPNYAVAQLDLSNVTIDDGWSVEIDGNPQYSLVRNKYTVLAVHTRTLKELQHAKSGNR